MCYDEGTLLAYLDGELPAEQRTAIAAHAAECDDCARQLESLAADSALAAQALARLQRGGDVVRLGAALASAPDATQLTAARSPRAQSHWPRWIAIAAAALVLGSFGFAPVRNAAAGLLQVFRVQQIKTVAISQGDLASMSAALKKGGHVDLKSFGDVWIDGAASKPATVTLAEAQAAVNFPITLPSNQTTPPVLLLQNGQTYKFKLHVAAINEALRQYGSDRLLPESLDGKEFSIAIRPLVLARYPLPADVSTAVVSPRLNGLFVGQGRSPELTVPDGVDVAQLRDVLVNLPFVPDSVRKQIASVQDWQSTLLIPNIDGTARDVTVNDVTAVVVSPQSAIRDARKNVPGAPAVFESAMVLWNDNGVVRAVGGPFTEQQAIDQAKALIH